MTVKELIMKLMDLQTNLNTEVGISIRKKLNNEYEEEVLYVGAKGDIKIETPSQLGDPNIVWLEGEIKDDSEVIRREGVVAGE